MRCGALVGLAGNAGQDNVTKYDAQGSQRHRQWQQGAGHFHCRIVHAAASSKDLSSEIRLTKWHGPCTIYNKALCTIKQIEALNRRDAENCGGRVALAA